MRVTDGRWEDNFKMKLREGRRWVQLDHDENKKRSFVNTTMKF
jgi:hypothetical protein